MIAIKEKEGAKGMERRTTTSSRELMGNSQELIISHAGDEYRLRITSNNKLILTK